MSRSSRNDTSLNIIFPDPFSSQVSVPVILFLNIRIYYLFTKHNIVFYVIQGNNTRLKSIKAASGCKYFRQFFLTSKVYHICRKT